MRSKSAYTFHLKESSFGENNNVDINNMKGRLVFMKIEKIEKYLDEVSEGTDFDFRISEVRNVEIELYMQGDNPENEDWCMTLIIKNPKTKRELIELLYEEVWNLYDCFDVEEETYLMLEAKRNGFRGVPGVVDLVHNEEYKENALKKFAEKLRDLL